MAPKRFLDDQEHSCAEHKRSKLTEDFTTLHQPASSSPPVSGPDILDMFQNIDIVQESIDVNNLPESRSESIDGNTLTTTLSTSGGEIDHEFLEWLNGPESQTILDNFMNQEAPGATPFQFTDFEPTDVNALLEHPAEEHAVHVHDSFTPTSGTIGQDSSEEFNNAEHEAFLSALQSVESPHVDFASIEADMFKYVMEGGDFSDSMTAAGEPTVAAAPIADTCPLLLNGLDTEGSSAFTFNSEPVEEQTTSINDVLGILVQCVEPLQYVKPSTATEEQNYFMAPQSPQRLFEPDYEAMAAFEAYLQIGDEQTQPVDALDVLLDGQQDGTPQPLQTSALQNYESRDMAPPIRKWCTQTPTTVENQAESLYMPEHEDVDEAPKKVVVEEDEKPFRCETCDKRFKLKRSLQRHDRVEHTDRTLSCPHCDKTFKRNDARIAHGRKLHGVELPHNPIHRARKNAQMSGSTTPPGTPSEHNGSDRGQQGGEAQG
ncbi:hypothetical protein IWX90DRAFT_506301 [Phyllosticta citrichinensis]|uniref:C2H2-type domain-containing protein n=1 Tax=Phyllosticta citrichinensis TaxID=1130410 RepID=A0ABR1XMY7_9PEZI